MALRTLVIIACIFIAAFVYAGEPPATLHLTGNPTVDFFSATQHVPGEALSLAHISQEDALPSGRDEKSPWLAGTLSLAVPGAGEVYSKSYIKAALFAAIEATSWIVAYNYNKKGDRQTYDYHDYANTHWKASKYVNWTLENIDVLNPNLRPDPGYTSVQEEYGERIYPDGYDRGAPPSYDPPFREMNWGAMNAMEDAIRQFPDNGYSHQLPSWGEQQYYELIGKYSQFRSGWDDDGLPDRIDESSLPIALPASGHMIEYRNMRAQANDYYDVASTFVSVAVINHLVSAIDAFWSATRFNKSLHAEVRMRVQPTRFGVAPLTEAKISYTF
ncbi:MAG: hypothetical protein HY033_07995 [Ignavibacteriae bacterium]|nr:hypothetical protein [Ignavibacteria bacterium]MBI3364833.1 hypothetical protein [Ignavibacteriota bacterium]